MPLVAFCLKKKIVLYSYLTFIWNENGKKKKIMVGYVMEITVMQNCSCNNLFVFFFKKSDFFYYFYIIDLQFLFYNSVKKKSFVVSFSLFVSTSLSY